MPQAKSAHRQAKSVITGFFKNICLGQTFETSVAKKAVKQCVDSVIANQDAMLWLGLLKDVDEYTAQHSLNVGPLSIVLGRAEGLASDDLEILGLCGMCMTWEQVWPTSSCKPRLSSKKYWLKGR